MSNLSINEIAIIMSAVSLGFSLYASLSPGVNLSFIERRVNMLEAVVKKLMRSAGGSDSLEIVIPVSELEDYLDDPMDYYERKLKKERETR